ncbi:Uncharacterized conserved protein [Achromobacter ruhlandii]|nr:Uncharacterized conserved protein [Achromobacter ruhlandii]
MQYVLVSACLLGHPVRYDGRSVPGDHAVLAGWLDAGRVVSVCPEVAGGLPIPRPPRWADQACAASRGRPDRRARC